MHCRNFLFLHGNNDNRRNKNDVKISPEDSSEVIIELNENKVEFKSAQNSKENNATEVDAIEKLLPRKERLETIICVDSRSFEERKDEINDTDLNHYLSNGISKKRRSAICEKILREEKNNELLEFMVYLMREDNIKNFLL